MDPALAYSFDFFPGWVLAALIAPVAGSFLGLLALRLPEGREVIVARSACDHCGAVLGVRELVPLLSYALQRGRCRHCGSGISPLHPAMELGCIAIALWGASVPDNEPLWTSCALGWLLLALAVCDWRTHLLPDALSLPLLLLGLAITAWLSWPDLADHALAAALGYTLLRGLALAYRHVRGREGLGAGDAKLLAVAGAWLGVAALPWVLLIATLAGFLLATVLALCGQRLSGRTPIPFGPCLAFSIWLVWLYG